MDGIAWLFPVLSVALLAFGIVGTVLRGRRVGVDQRHCPHCETPMSMRRVSRPCFCRHGNAGTVAIGVVLERA
jgi:hypothetical protein